MADNTIKLDKIEFKNLPSGNTPVNDENLNLVQENVEKFGNVIATKAANKEEELEDTLIKQAEEFKDLKRKNKMLMADYETEEIKGESIHITDSAEYDMPLFPMANNPIQDTREGYNLLPYPYQNTTKTENGITFTDNGDGTVTANGTATARTMFALYGLFNAQKTLPKGFLSGGVNSQAFIRVMNNTSSTYTLLAKSVGDENEINLSTYTEGYIEIVIESGATVNDAVFKPMISETSGKIFEQYGQMPSKDFPSEVKGVTGHYDNVIENKNILNLPEFTETKNGITLSYNKGVATLKGKAILTQATFFSSHKVATVKAGKPYYFNRDIQNLSGDFKVFLGVRTGAFNTEPTFTTSLNSKTFDVSGDVLFMPYFSTIQAGTEVDLTFRPQLEENTLATEYIEHQEQNLPIDLTQDFVKNYVHTLETANISGTGTIAKESGFSLVIFKVPKGNYHLKRKSGVTVTWVLSQSTNIPTYGDTITPRTVVSGVNELDYEVTNDGYLVLRNSDTLSLEEFLNDLYITSEDVGFNKVLYNPDCIVKLTDAEIEKLGLEKAELYFRDEYLKVILDGTEVITLANTGTENWYYNFNFANNLKFLTGVQNSIGNAIFSNMYKNVAIANANTVKGISIYTTSIRIREDIEDTANNFKARIKELYDNGTPLYVVYKLEKPKYTPIKDENFIKQYKALQAAQSYERVTNINSYGGEEAAPLVLSGEYVRSNKVRIENLEKQIAAIVEESA